MNIRQNPITQRAASPQLAPKTTSHAALAEQLKAEGEKEVARGEQLQKDGVELQSQGEQQKESGENIVDLGKNVKAFGQTKVDEGAAEKAAGQEKVDTGIAAENTARDAETQHAESFQQGLDAAKAANQSSGQALESMQEAMTTETNANAADTKSLSDYEGHLTLAGLATSATGAVVDTANAELANDRAAQEQITGATPGYIAGVDAQAAGRAIQMDGRNDVRKADDLKAESETELNRAKAYLDRAIGHTREADRLGEEVDAHNEQGEKYTNQAGIADASGDIAKAKSEDQAAVAALMAAKAAIDADAADGLKGLSHFKEEADRTKKDSMLAFTQHLRAGQHSKFYGSLSEGLYEEAGQLNSRADSEASEAERKTGQIGDHNQMAIDDAGRAVNHYQNHGELEQKSADTRKEGEAKIADGTTKYDAGAAQVEENLGIIADGVSKQESSHKVQEAQIEVLKKLNHGSEVSIETRQGILNDLKTSNATQADAQATQSAGIDTIKGNQSTLVSSMEQRQTAVAGLKTEGANISAAIAQQDEGFTQRKEGADIEEVGATIVRGGEAIIEKGNSEIEEGEAKKEEGRQDVEAGKVIVDKGQKYQELANPNKDKDGGNNGGGQQGGGQAPAPSVQQQAAEIPFLVAR